MEAGASTVPEIVQDDVSVKSPLEGMTQVPELEETIVLVSRVVNKVSPAKVWLVCFVRLLLLSYSAL